MTIKGLTNSSIGLNTGKVSNSLQPGIVVSGILVPYDWKLDISVAESDTAIVTALEDALTDLLINDTYTERGHYVGPFEAFNDQSEATTYQTFGYGRKVKTQRRIITKAYEVFDGGIQYWRALQSFNGKINQYKWLEIDNQGVIYGTQYFDPTTGKVTAFTGIELSSLEAEDRIQANKTTVEQRIFNITIADSGEVNENLFTIETGIELDSFVQDLGVQDVVFTPTGVMVGHISYFRVTAGDGGLDMTALLPGMLIAANISAVNEETGVAVAVASASIEGNLLKVTYTTGSGGWDVGALVKTGLKAVSVIATSGYKYYECASEAATAHVVMVA